MNSIVKYQAAIALLVTILSNFSDSDYCPASAPTVAVVSECPTNKTEWDQAASRKKCNLMSAKCGDKTPVYHCLLNQWRNETVEVCASTWYISGFCAVYNTNEMKVIDDFERDCTNFSEGKCSTRYISSEAYLYQKCYMQKSSNKIPLPDRPIRTEESEETNDCILSTIIAIVVTVLVLVIITLVVFIILPLKISKKAPDEECMLFCNATTQIAEESETESETEKLLEKNVNKENRVDQTKKTAESSSCGDPVEMKQKPDTAETCGVDYSKPPVVNEIRAQFVNKENRVDQTKKTAESSSCGDPVESKQKPDVKQKADQTIRSHRNSINGEENVEERENSPDPTPSETGIKAPNTKAKDPAAGTGNAVQNEIAQKVDHTVKNDVDFPSHGNPTNEENTEDENNQSPDSTPRECVTNTTDAKSQDPEEYTENCIPNEKFKKKADDTNDGGVSPDKIVQDRKQFWEFKKKADDTNDGGVSPDKIVQDRKQFWEMKLGAAGESSTPKARTTPSSFGDT